MDLNLDFGKLDEILKSKLDGLDNIPLLSVDDMPDIDIDLSDIQLHADLDF